MTLALSDRVVACGQPDPSAAFVSFVDETCPCCGVSPFRVRGSDSRPSADDRAWESTGACFDCQTLAGTLRVEVSTIFGVREDAAVLHGRCRVY